MWSSNRALVFPLAAAAARSKLFPRKQQRDAPPVFHDFSRTYSFFSAETECWMAALRKRSFLSGHNVNLHMYYLFHSLCFPPTLALCCDIPTICLTHPKRSVSACIHFSIFGVRFGGNVRNPGEAVPFSISFTISFRGNWCGRKRNA